MVTPVVAGVGVAFPPTVSQQDLWDGFFADRYAGVRFADKIFANAGVAERHAVVDPMVEDISTLGTGDRMHRYLAEALPLGAAAVSDALADAGLTTAELGLLVVVSCTGYVTPGVDIGLAAALHLPDTVQRLVVGHMGCYAALPGLAAASDFVAARGRPAVLLCVELTSLHVQPASQDRADVVTHALFSDAAAAVVLRPAPMPGYEVLDTVAATDPTTAGQMTWDITDQGFRMGLSPRVPDSLRVALPGLIGRLLDRHGLAPADIAHWAVHPGGPRILDVVRDGLGLPETMMTASRETLRRHGNCSSATVLAVLRELPRAMPGDHLVMLAFGPGLTLYGALLRAT